MMKSSAAPNACRRNEAQAVQAKERVDLSHSAFHSHGRTEPGLIDSPNQNSSYAHFGLIAASCGEL